MKKNYESYYKCNDVKLQPFVRATRNILLGGFEEWVTDIDVSRAIVIRIFQSGETHVRIL